FTKGCKVLKIRALRPSHNTYQHTLGDFLFDLEADDGQQANLVETHPQVVKQMQNLMVTLLKESDAMEETYTRYGLT
ncbi:MAG: hypothetical protein WC233_09430, partial [Sphaerochaeta sp.]